MRFAELAARPPAGPPPTWHAGDGDLGHGCRRAAYALTTADLTRLYEGDTLELDVWGLGSVLIRLAEPAPLLELDAMVAPLSDPPIGLGPVIDNPPAPPDGAILAPPGTSMGSGVAALTTKATLEITGGDATKPLIHVQGEHPTAVGLRFRVPMGQTAPLWEIVDAAGAVLGGLDAAGGPFGCLATLKVELIKGFAVPGTGMGLIDLGAPKPAAPPAEAEAAPAGTALADPAHPSWDESAGFPPDQLAAVINGFGDTDWKGVAILSTPKDGDTTLFEAWKASLGEGAKTIQKAPGGGPPPPNP